MADEVVIRCHCGKLTETVLLRQTLPVPGTMCHCNICRQVTGTLTFTGISLSNPPAEAFQQKLIKYATSEKIWRYFCPTCGSQVVYYVPKEDRWSVCPGAIDEVKKGQPGKIHGINGHEFVADSVDGGLSLCLPGVPYWLDGDGVPPVKDLQSELSRLHREVLGESEEERLRAECRCGQIKFYIGRPDTEPRWRAAICTCRSCRLSFSQTLVTWVMNVQMDKIVWEDGTPYDDGIVRKGLQRFQSSKKVHRDFCSTCGASVIYSAESEPGVVDVAAGLLRSREGALARSWLKWDPKILFIEEATDKALMDVMKENMTLLNDS